MDPVLTAAVSQLYGSAENKIRNARTTMAEKRIDRKQRLRIQLTAGALFVVVTLMFISAAFLSLRA